MCRKKLKLTDSSRHKVKFLAVSPARGTDPRKSNQQCVSFKFAGSRVGTRQVGKDQLSRSVIDLQSLICEYFCLALSITETDCK